MQILQTDGSRLLTLRSGDSAEHEGRDHPAADFSRHIAAADQKDNEVEIVTVGAPVTTTETASVRQSKNPEAAASPPPKDIEETQPEPTLHHKGDAAPESSPGSEEPRQANVTSDGSVEAAAPPNKANVQPSKASEREASPFSALVKGLSATHRSPGQSEGQHSLVHRQLPHSTPPELKQVQQIDEKYTDAKERAKPVHSQDVEPKKALPAEIAHTPKAGKQTSNGDRVHVPAYSADGLRADSTAIPKPNANLASSELVEARTTAPVVPSKQGGNPSGLQQSETSNANTIRIPGIKNSVAPQNADLRGTGAFQSAETTPMLNSQGQEQIKAITGGVRGAEHPSRPQSIAVSHDKQVGHVAHSLQHSVTVPANAEHASVRLEHTSQQSVATASHASTTATSQASNSLTATAGQQVLNVTSPKGSDLVSSQSDPTQRMTEMVWDARTFAPSMPTLITQQPNRAELSPPTLQTVMEALRQANDGPIEIALKPAELGRVRMVMATHENGITVTITADRGDTLDLMRRHADDLGKSLTELGYGDVSFSFERGQHHADHGDNQTEESRTADVVPPEPISAHQEASSTKTIAPTSAITSIDMRF